MLQVPALLGGGMATYQAAQGAPTMKSLEGVDVPFNAPMAEKRSALDALRGLADIAASPVGGPLAGGSLGTLLLASDVLPHQVVPEAVSTFANEHSAPVAGLGAATLAGLRRLFVKRAEIVKRAHVLPNPDGVTSQPIDAGNLCRDLSRVWVDLV